MTNTIPAFMTQYERTADEVFPHGASFGSFYAADTGPREVWVVPQHEGTEHNIELIFSGDDDQEYHWAMQGSTATMRQALQLALSALDESANTRTVAYRLTSSPLTSR